MSIVLADRVKETTTTTGTGTVDLAGAATGYQGFVAGAGDAAVVYYAIVGQAGGGAAGEWETGIGTVTDAATDTLSRTTILSSSNAGAGVDFSAGTKDVFLTLPAKAPVTLTEVITPSSAATADIDIAGCEAVEIVGWLRPATDNVNAWLRFSNDGGSSFREGASDYAWAQSYLSTSGVYADDHDPADVKIQMAINVGDAEYMALNIMILNAAASGVYTSALAHVTWHTPGNTFPFGSTGGSVLTAEVNNAVRIMFSSGDIASGRLAVYRYPAP